MSLSLAIQHHPARPYLLEPLLAALGAADVVCDPDPDNPRRGPWRTYRRALEETPEWATHRAVIQDDATPCEHFPAVAERALAARPDALVVFSVLGSPTHWVNAVRDANAQGEHWAELRVAFWQSWLPVIAIAWPVSFIRPLLDWVDTQDFPAAYRADDEIVGKGAAALNLPVLATVPSLVRHDDVVESTIRRRTGYGRNPDRVTYCPLSDGCDPRTIDWG